MSEPDVIGDDRARSRGPTAAVIVLALGLLVALTLNTVGHKGPAKIGPVPSSSALESVTPTAMAAAADIVLRVGDEIYEAVGNRLILRDQLPSGATDVWATTLAVKPSDASAHSPAIHVFGVHDGVAFQQDIGATSSLLVTLGPANRMLQMVQYPLLVHDGDPVTVGAVGGSAALPGGWLAGHFENLYAGVLVRPTDHSGVVEIAVWSAAGAPQPLTTAGKLLGVTNDDQAIWLDPSCPDGPSCALHVGGIGGLHPQGGFRAPAGTRYTDGPAALGYGGYVAAVATTGATSVLIRVESWAATGDPVIIPGSEGVLPSAGMFWLDGKHLVFVSGDPPGQGDPRPRLMLYDVDTNVIRPFGPTLPSGIRLLTAFGSAGGVTVLP